MDDERDRSAAARSARRLGARRSRRRRRVGGAVAGVALLAGGGVAVGTNGQAVSPTRTARATTGIAAPVRAGIREGRARARDARVVARIAEGGRPVYCGRGVEPLVALTFDDGPSTVTPEIMATLSRARARASFFLVGSEVRTRRRLARAQSRVGWDVGEHTWAHPVLTRLPPPAVRREISRGASAVRTATHRRPRFFRAPYAARSARIDREAGRRGMIEVLWNVDTQDGVGADSATIVQRAVAGLRPGSIVLMHDTKEATARALPQILAALRRRGLRAVTLSRLLGRDTPTRRQLRDGAAGCPLIGDDEGARPSQAR